MIYLSKRVCTLILCLWIQYIALAVVPTFAQQAVENVPGYIGLVEDGRIVLTTIEPQNLWSTDRLFYITAVEIESDGRSYDGVFHPRYDIPVFLGRRVRVSGTMRAVKGESLLRLSAERIEVLDSGTKSGYLEEIVTPELMCRLANQVISNDRRYETLATEYDVLRREIRSLRALCREDREDVENRIQYIMREMRIGRTGDLLQEHRVGSVELELYLRRVLRYLASPEEASRQARLKERQLRAPYVEVTCDYVEQEDNKMIAGLGSGGLVNLDAWLDPLQRQRYTFVLTALHNIRNIYKLHGLNQDRFQERPNLIKIYNGSSDDEKYFLGRAQVYAYDESTDLALLVMPRENTLELAPILPERFLRYIHEGIEVSTIGAPAGTSWAVTEGEIRAVDGEGAPLSFWRMDAPIMQGNSGGLVYYFDPIDQQMWAVGVVSAMFAPKVGGKKMQIHHMGFFSGPNTLRDFLSQSLSGQPLAVESSIKVLFELNHH